MSKLNPFYVHRNKQHSHTINSQKNNGKGGKLKGPLGGIVIAGVGNGARTTHGYANRVRLGLRIWKP